MTPREAQLQAALEEATQMLDDAFEEVAMWSDEALEEQGYDGQYSGLREQLNHAVAKATAALRRRPEEAMR